MKAAEQLTANFRRSEFACKGLACCGGTAAIAPEFVEMLQRLRDLVGKPIVVNSGFRCLKHNRAVGSNDTSQHPLGLAADLAIPVGMTADQLAAVAESLGLFGGIGIYPTWVHVDIGPAGRRW